jgi:hypothetical protein
VVLFRPGRPEPAVRHPDGRISPFYRAGVISINEAKRLLRETLEIQRVLVDMKLQMEDETVS